MKKTMIISTFPACGKTYLYKHQENIKIHDITGEISPTFCDLDSSAYCKGENWEKNYIDDIERKIGSVDFILISQHDEVLAELHKREIPFVVVSPDNSEWLSEKERDLIKQQWFGRFLLRDNSHIKNFESWLNHLKINYDNWTSIDSLYKYDPVTVFTLQATEYLSDIIKDLYWKKEHFLSADYVAKNFYDDENEKNYNEDLEYS